MKKAYDKMGTWELREGYEFLITKIEGYKKKIMENQRLINYSLFPKQKNLFQRYNWLYFYM